MVGRMKPPLQIGEYGLGRFAHRRRGDGLVSTVGLELS
jgi:hypothetical protein